RLAAALTVTVTALAPSVSGASQAPPAPVVTAVEIVSAHRLTGPPPAQFLTGLAGRPFSRARVRESLDRLWALGMFDKVEVDAVDEPGGVRLRYRVSRRPFLESLDWAGELGLEAADLAATAALALGGPAEPERLERARSEVLARLRREGYLGATARLDVRENPATNGRAVTVVVDAGKEALVGRVEITGLARAEVEPLRKALDLDEGDKFEDRRFRDGVRAFEAALHAQGFFESRVTTPAPAFDAATDRVDLTVQVVEGPRTRVEFVGRAALTEAALRERMVFADDRIVDDVELRASADQILKGYHEAGYHFAKVAGTLGGDASERIVKFEIYEGPRVTVESLAFEGPATLSAKQLAEQMRTRPAGLIPIGVFKGLFVEERLEEDLRLLRQYYRTQGFPSAEVGPPRVTFNDDGTRARIVLPVIEGSRRMVSAVTVTGHHALGVEPILKAIGFRAGDPWDAVKAEDGRHKVEQLYQRRGYRGTTVGLSTADKDGAVSASYTVQEGELTRIGQITISGLTATKPYVVQRELQFETGESLTAVALSEARRRLDATRLFDRVDVEPLGDPNAPIRDVQVVVREAKPWRFELGAGYDTEEGFRGFMTLGYDNLFGTGRSASVRQRLSQKGSRSEVNYREPWIFGSSWMGEALLFRERTQEIGYVSDSIGSTLTVERDLLTNLLRPEEPTDHPKSLRTGFRYRVQEYRRDDIDPDLIADGSIRERDDLVTSVLSYFTLELRDLPSDPRQGSYHFAGLEVGSSALGGTINFVKFRLEDTWLFSWPPRTVVAVATRFGLAAPYADTADLVIEDRFKAGGATTVRGYSLDHVGPLDAGGNPQGGDLRILLNLEWRFPLYRWLGGVVFFDAGMVTPRLTDFAWDAFHPGVGGGLRIVTPVGPIRLDVGYGLRQVRNDDRLQVYLTVGQAF
ncbi:MAG: POTRA domain-containing protein, partial [Candidatus Rokuibacteriota bacterium]